MARYHLTQDHFHYDNSGYYGYILFSGTNAELHELLKALGRGDKAHGFGWHRWGRSFRPADNGIVYDYYIRLRGKGDTKPSAAAVDEFLRKTIPSRQTLTRATEKPKERTDETPTQQQQPSVAGDSADPPLWMANWLARNDAMNHQINIRLQNLSNGIPSLQALQDNIHSLKEIEENIAQLRTQIGSVNEARQEVYRLEILLEQTKQELAESEDILAKKEKEIETLHKAPRAESYDKNMQEEREKAERAADKARKERDQLKRDKIPQLNVKIRRLEEELKEVRNERDYLREQVEEIGKAYQEAREQKSSDADIDVSDVSDSEGFEDNLSKTLDNVFPELELVHDSPERIGKFPNPWNLLKELRMIVIDKNVRGERIKNAEDWYERRLNRDWRIYFCNKGNLLNGKVTILIGNKNTQPSDLRWLSNNSPSSCL